MPLCTARFPVFIPLSYSKCVCLCVLFTSSFAARLFLFFSCKTLSVIVRRGGKICRDVYRGVTRNLERRRGGRNGGRKSWDPSQNKSDEKGQRLLRGAGGELAGEGGVESRAGWEFVSVHFHSLQFSFHIFESVFFVLSDHKLSFASA